MIRYLPEFFSMPELFLGMALAAVAIAMIAHCYLGDKK